MGRTNISYTKERHTVCFISDLRKLNKRILRQPYPIPKIQDLLLRLEGFRYGTTLDLNMGYYHINSVLSQKNFSKLSPNGASTSINDSPWVCAKVPTLFKKDVWTLRWSRHSTFLHWWPLACYKRLFDRTSYCPRRDVHPPQDGWAQVSCRRKYPTASCNIQKVIDVKTHCV